jgi:hypothetical protein
MIPRTLPAGTTLRSLIEQLLADDHAANVPKSAGDATLSVRLVGGPTYAFAVNGDRLRVRETSRVEPAPLLLSFEESTAQLFLDDWLGAQRLAPSFEPRGLTSVTDPRLIRRFAAIKGVLELTLDDFEGQSVSMIVAAGPDASLYDDPDARVRIKMPAFERLLAGTLRPDEAIADGHVLLSGKKLVAMQFALALVPYFPPRG